MTIMRILALDPGGTTGWATFTADRFLDDGNYVYMNPQFRCGQIGPEEHHLALYNFLGDQQCSIFTIVCERFEYRNISRAGLDLSSKEYIGVVNLFQQERMFNREPFEQALVYQNASEGKVRDKPTAFVKPSNIKKLGLWSPGYKHAMDGYGHLLYYMTNAGNVMRDELLRKGWK